MSDAASRAYYANKDDKEHPFVHFHCCTRNADNMDCDCAKILRNMVAKRSPQRGVAMTDVTEYRDDKEHVPADKPHGDDNRQRWWVDYPHRIQSGTLIDLSDTQAVVRRSDGHFEIKTPGELYRSHLAACEMAVKHLGKVQHEASLNLSALLCEMSKQAKGKA